MWSAYRRTVIEKWIEQALTTRNDQRRHGRRPFFRSAVLTQGADERGIPAFCRDISTSGIGLVHQVPLDSDDVRVSIATGKQRRIELCVSIRWCRSLAEGWYISGGQFNSLNLRTMLDLAWTTLKSELERRSTERQPLLRPVSIRTLGSLGMTVLALCRDISPGGIGLFHSVPLQTKHVWLQLDPPLDISTRIRWCRKCADGWYMSGGAFTKLQLEELPRLGP